MIPQASELMASATLAACEVKPAGTGGLLLKGDDI